MDARRLVRTALRAASPSLEELARVLSVSSSALRKYRQGTRSVPGALCAALARALRAQAARLTALADRLERAGRD
jgi:transcriptional regulator with XRE-family HTH domain